MKTLRLIVAATGMALLLPMSGAAQSLDELSELDPETRRAYVESLSEDERKALREQRRARWEAMALGDVETRPTRLAARNSLIVILPCSGVERAP